MKTIVVSLLLFLFASCSIEERFYSDEHLVDQYRSLTVQTRSDQAELLRITQVIDFEINYRSYCTYVLGGLDSSLFWSMTMTQDGRDSLDTVRIKFQAAKMQTELILSDYLSRGTVLSKEILESLKEITRLKKDLQRRHLFLPEIPDVQYI